MSAKDSWLVEHAPTLLKLLGAIFILADGPLPFGDAVGWVLIGYGSALSASYKLADAAVYVENAFSNDIKEILPLPPRIGPPGGSATIGPHFQGRPPLSGATRTGWCTRHRRYDRCRSR